MNKGELSLCTLLRKLEELETDPDSKEMLSKMHHQVKGVHVDPKFLPMMHKNPELRAKVVALFRDAQQSMLKIWKLYEAEITSKPST